MRSQTLAPSNYLAEGEQRSKNVERLFWRVLLSWQSSHQSPSAQSTELSQVWRPAYYVSLHHTIESLQEMWRADPDLPAEASGRTDVRQGDAVDWHEIVQDCLSYSELAQAYRFRNAPAVATILCEQPALFRILKHAYELISKHFGQNPEVVLEVVADPEVAGAEELFAYVRTALPPEEALERLRRIDRDWGDVSEVPPYPFVISVEFE